MASNPNTRVRNAQLKKTSQKYRKNINGANRMESQLPSGINRLAQLPSAQRASWSNPDGLQPANSSIWLETIKLKIGVANTTVNTMRVIRRNQNILLKFFFILNGFSRKWSELVDMLQTRQGGKSAARRMGGAAFSRYPSSARTDDGYRDNAAPPILRVTRLHH
jgi:hypothetical protein